MSDSERLREALGKIAELARNSIHGEGAGLSADDSQSHTFDTPGCAIKALPARLLRKAASNAIKINPANAPMMAPIGGDGLGVMDPMSIAVMTTKYWGAQPRQLTVSFMDSASPALRTESFRT